MHRARFVLPFLLPILLVVHPGTAACGPLLNEVLAGPARDWDGDGVYNSRNDEWIEVVNPGSSTLDLNGFYLGDQDGGFVYGFTGGLGPGAVAVIYGAESVVWETAHGVSTTGLRLTNAGDTATLWQVIAGDTLLVDAYTYNGNEGASDRSTGRVPDGGAAWQIFDALNPYHGTTPPLGNGLPPTPGLRNDGEEGPPNPVAQETWGAIKALFVP